MIHDQPVKASDGADCFILSSKQTAVWQFMWLSIGERAKKQESLSYISPPQTCPRKTWDMIYFMGPDI